MAELNFDIFSGMELTPEEKELIYNGEQAAISASESQGSLYERESLSKADDYLNTQENSLLSTMNFEDDADITLENLFKLDMDNLMKEELANKETDDGFLERMSDGILDFGVSAIGGVFVAGSEIVDAADSALEYTTDLMGLDVDVIGFDEERTEFKNWFKDNEFTKSTSGQIGQGIGQFMTGFVPIFRAIKGISYLNNTAKKVIAADALTSGLVFDPDDPNVFNMIQHVKWLKPLDDATGNAVTKMLATDPSDPELYNRFRNATAGILEGKAVDTLFSTLKVVALQSKKLAQDKLGLFKGPYDSGSEFIGPRQPTEVLSAIQESNDQVRVLNQEYDKVTDPEQRTSILNSIVTERTRLKRLESDLDNKPNVDEAAFDFESNQLSRDSQEKIELEVNDSKVELDNRLDTALTERYEKLPNKSKEATPSFHGQRVNFQDDIIKSIYIVTDPHSLKIGKLKNVKNKSNIHAEYQRFLTDTVGMSETEIFEVGKRIDRDLKANKTVGSLRMYRLEMQKDILSGDLQGIELKFQPKADPEGIKAVNVPISQASKPLAKAITGKDLEGVAELSLEAFKETPLWKEGLPKDVKIKTGKDKQGLPVEKSNITGQPKYIFKSKRTGKPFQIEHGNVNTPKDLDNLYTWLRRELSDEGMGPRVKLRAEEAKAHELLPEAMTSEDPLGFMLEKGISAETAILSRLVHGTALHNIRDLALKRVGGDKSIKTQNDYLQALAYWANAHVWQGVIARRAAQATRAFGHEVQSGANMEVLNEILSQANSTTSVPFVGGLDKLSEMIAKTDSVEGVNGTIDAVMNKSGITDVMMEYYMGVGLLSGISTQLANLMGGMGVATVMQPVEKMVGRIWGDLSTTPEAVKELIDGYVGLFGGTLKNLKLASKTVWEGKPQGFSAQKMEVRNQTITGDSVLEAGEARVSALRFLGNLNRGGTRFLIGGDDFVRSSIHTMQVTTAARKQARETGLTGDAFKERVAYLQKYPEALKDYDSIKLESTRLGDEATFTQRLDGLAASLGDTVYKYPLLRLFTPFVKVMYNLPKYFIERDPLSQGVRYGVSAIKGGEFSQKVLNDENFRNNWYSKMATGTMLLGMGTMLAVNGVITGSSRKDYGKEKNKMMINHFSNSIRYEDSETGKIKNIDYSRLEPYASFFQYSSDLVELLPQLSEGDANEVVSQAVWAMSDNIVSDTWVPGLTEFLNVISGKTTERSVEAALKRMVSGFTPAISRELSKKRESFVPESKAGALNLFDDKMVKYGSTAKQQSFQQLLMRMYSTVNGYNNYSKYDRWGNVMLKGGSDPVEAHPLEIILPWNVKRQKYDKVDEYIDEIGLELTDLKPSIEIPKTNGGPVPLNPAQFEQYNLLATKDLSGLPMDRQITYKDVLKLRNAPSRLKGMVSELINDKEFRELQVSGFATNNNQREIIKKMVYDERKAARSILLEIKGNESLVSEALLREQIARENPDIIFN